MRCRSVAPMRQVAVVQNPRHPRAYPAVGRSMSRQVLNPAAGLVLATSHALYKHSPSRCRPHNQAENDDARCTSPANTMSRTTPHLAFECVVRSDGRVVCTTRLKECLCVALYRIAMRCACGGITTPVRDIENQVRRGAYLRFEPSSPSDFHSSWCSTGTCDSRGGGWGREKSPTWEEW